MINEWKYLFPKKNKYLETDKGILYHGDCLDILNNFSYEIKFDLILLDPDFKEWNLYLNKQYLYYLNSNSYLITFSRQPYTTQIMNYFTQYLEFRDELIWYDTQPIWVSNNLPLRTHENILIFRKGNKPINPFVGEKNKLYGQEINKGSVQIAKWKPQNKRVYIPKERKMITSVIEASRNLKDPLGRWGKPRKLIEIIIKCFSNKDDLIFDPFTGSGNIVQTSEKLDRRWVGVEKKNEYCEIIKEKMKNNLF